MSSLPKRSRGKFTRFKSADDWPSTPRIDGTVWCVSPDADAPAEVESTGPTDADAEWAASNLNEGWDDDGPPDEVYDALAAEDAEMERMQRGIRCW